MTKKFKLNTATITWGRVKGWNWDCELFRTVRNHRAEDRQELITLIKSELEKVRIKKSFEESNYNNTSRDLTRRRRKIGLRVDRAYDKERLLEQALKAIESDEPNKI